MSEHEKDCCKTCDESGCTSQKVDEIHRAIVGTTEKTGLLARTEKLESRVKLHDIATGSALLGIVSYAFHTITKVS